MKKIILFIIILFNLNLAFSQQAVNDSTYQKNQLAYPQKAKCKYKFNRQKYKDRLKKNLSKTFLDTQAIYINKAYDSNLKDSVYRFYRFFTHGEVFISDLYLSEPDSLEANDLSYGTWCMYTINEKGNLLVEQPVRSDFVNWYYDYAKISANGLLFYKTHYGRLITNSSVNMNFFWRKKTVAMTNYTIDWK